MNKTNNRPIFSLAGLKYTGYLLCLLFVYLAGSANITPAQDLSKKIQSIAIEGQKIKAEKITNVLANIAHTYDVPLGFVCKTYALHDVDENAAAKVPLEKAETKEILPRDGKLPNVLDELIKFDPDYKWEIIEEVIVISPAKNEDQDVAAILKTNITTAEMDFGDGFWSVGTSLIILPELRKTMKNLGVESFLWPHDSHNSPRTKLSVKNLTVNTILNTVVKKSSFKFWLIGKGRIENYKSLEIITD